MDESNQPKQPRGGFRPGAGRKPGSGLYQEPTTVMRVPVSEAGAIRDFLSALVQKRRKEASDNVAGMVELEDVRKSVSLPLYTTKVAAGFPSPAEDHVERRLDPTDYLVQNDSATFFVRVKGESMIDAGIFDSDVLIVDRSLEARAGDIVLAMLDGEFTVKTLGIVNQRPRLIPANKLFEVIEIKDGQAFEILGVVTGSMRKFR